jgi:hypothetical protein
MKVIGLFAARITLPLIGVASLFPDVLSLSLVVAKEKAPIAHESAKDPSCPSRKPEVFFESFTKDADIQKAFTDFPLQYGYTVGFATSKYITISKFDELPFLSRTHKRIAEHSGIGNAPNDLYFEFQEMTPKAFVVGIGRMNSDYYITYDFILRNNCWHLIQVDDLNDRRDQ